MKTKILLTSIFLGMIGSTCYAQRVIPQECNKVCKQWENHEEPFDNCLSYCDEHHYQAPPCLTMTLAELQTKGSWWNKGDCQISPQPDCRYCKDAKLENCKLSATCLTGNFNPQTYNHSTLNLLEFDNNLSISNCNGTLKNGPC